MIAATSGPSAAFTSSTCTQPSSRAGTGFTVKPIRAAVAGLVPWAESGTSTVRRGAAPPPAAVAALFALLAGGSPRAPAFRGRGPAGTPGGGGGYTPRP